MRVGICILICVSMFGGLLGQTVDKVKGCIPLEVQFTPESGLSAHFWDFKDGTSSDLSNPVHIYTMAGIYDVELFEGVGGAMIGTVRIEVLALPELIVSVDDASGCAPFTVNFQNQSIVPDGIASFSYRWSFGDGNGSLAENPAYTYTQAGNYTVTLEIITNDITCDVTNVMTNFIEVKQTPSPSFTASPSGSCTLPATVNFTNTTSNDDGNSYLWDFGNGATSTDYNPPAQIYITEGSNDVQLTVTNNIGCSRTIIRRLFFGSPQIEYTVADTICAGVPTIIDNTTDASAFTWTFSSDADVDNIARRSPTVTYLTGGLKTITLSARTSACVSDSTFTIFVDKPNANFTIDPTFICSTPSDLRFEAANTTYDTYLWSLDNTVNSSTLISSFDLAPVDSFFINVLEMPKFSLTVTSSRGCSSTVIDSIAMRKPEAHFLPDQTSGCAPLNVTFNDRSLSESDIISRTWFYGDGQQAIRNNADDHGHAYNNPGTYYVKLIVENENGCIDTSYAVKIEVGEPIVGDFTTDKTSICIGDSVHLESILADERIDTWHFETDGSRSFHCPDRSSLDHVFFSEPGLMDVTLTLEYNGCYSSVTKDDFIEVKGPLAKIDYMVNCANPYDIMFFDTSQASSEVTWTFPPDSMIVQADPVFHFNARGDYTVYLEARNPTTGCPASLDSVVVKVRDVQSIFEIEDKICDGTMGFLDASASLGVDTRCHKGYTWVLPTDRPRTVASDSIDYVFQGSGDQEFFLITEDVNGCRDTMRQTTRLYNVTTEFEQSLDTICLPMDVSFSDLTTSDTTLTSWMWSFGSEDQNPSHTFTSGTNPITVTLTAEDVLGCSGTFDLPIVVYEPISLLSLSDRQLCVGDEIFFSGTDFTDQGSFLNFNWDFGNGNVSMDRQGTVAYNTPGEYAVTLNIEEDATGCRNTITDLVSVQGFPDVDYISSVDGENLICHPQLILFTNATTTDWPTTYIWDFGNGQQSTLEDPSAGFTKGTFDVTLVGQTSFGCRDTLTQSYTLVGPEGDFSMDNSIICRGDAITFTLENPIDVTNFTWDFGDGTETMNVSPVTHTFDFHPPSGETIVKLILEAEDSGCTFDVEKPVSIRQVIAGFTETLDNGICNASFVNTSTGANQFVWDFGDGTMSTDVDPDHSFPGPGVYEVTLTITDTQSGCQEILTRSIEFFPTDQTIVMPNVFSPNNDGQNDFFNYVYQGIDDRVLNIVSFKVFNRWGQVVYDNDNEAMGWDGMIKGGPAPQEVYAYFIENQLKNGETEVYKGNVTLFR